MGDVNSSGNADSADVGLVRRQNNQLVSVSNFGADLNISGNIDTAVGEEAFWSGNRVGGALYVLKKENMVRVSVGGPDNEETKINKSKALAEKVLAKL